MIFKYHAYSGFLNNSESKLLRLFILFPVVFHVTYLKEHLGICRIGTLSFAVEGCTAPRCNGLDS